MEKMAQEGRRTAIDFPRAWLEEGSLDFSFSGLKSSVLNYLNQGKMKGISVSYPDVAASFQEALFEVLTVKAIAACRREKAQHLVLSGGVAANGRLRELLSAATAYDGITFHYPPKILCTDNAAMIGAVAYYKFIKEDFSSMALNASANLCLL